MMQVGWASVDITPPRPVVLQGQFYTRVSERVNDPLTATALAIEGSADGEATDQAVMVSCDRVNIPGFIQERVREVAGRRLAGFDVGKLFLNATHTHTAPQVSEGSYPPPGQGVMTATEYADLLVERVADMVVQAWEGRRPGGVTWAFGQAVVGHNRRAVYFDGSAKMYGDTDDEQFDCIEGYEDHSLNVLFFWDEEQRLTGTVLNLACPSQVTENAYYVSADFWHEVRTEVRRRHGDGLFILPQCAPAGDQSPHFLIGKKEEAYMRERLALTEREVIAQEIANAVDELLPSARDHMQTDPVVRHVVRTVALPVRMVTDVELAAAEEELERRGALEPESEKDASLNFVHMGRCRGVIERHGQQKSQPTYPLELHVLRLGEVAIATNPFELFLDFGIRIKARSKALQTFLVQLVGDSRGYLPTAKAVAARSYGAEVASNHVGPEGGQVLVEATVEEIARLWRTDSL
ncbi:MAG: hypothetical protein KAX44_08860 [Candidatus Brocadiae bacterium]|nr:hypothetical protein [Candidatus Brocadiia bacterium]